LAETRDTDTGLHLERIREYCLVLADEVSSLEKYQATMDGNYSHTLYLTSPLHDIGKVGIEDRILLKPGPLTADEFEIMKRHTLLGGQTLGSLTKRYPDAYYLQLAAHIALTHHERYDGKGYPHGLARDDIPLCGRIVALADVYDALTSKRVYKPAFSHEKAREIILDGRGTQFDPDMVDAFQTREAEFQEIRQRLGDGGAPQPTPS
jgi:putative two-component system response regulator